jgi:hypothetical protein
VPITPAREKVRRGRAGHKANGVALSWPAALPDRGQPITV